MISFAAASDDQITEQSPQNLETLWDEVLASIQPQINSQSFKTWFEPIKPMRVEGNELVVNVPSQFFFEWLEEHYHSLFMVGKGSFWNGKFALTVPLIWHLTTSEWIVQPSVAYRPSDGLEVTLGYSGIFGPDNSLLDLVGPVLSALYLSVKLTF